MSTKRKKSIIYLFVALTITVSFSEWVYQIFSRYYNDSKQINELAERIILEQKTLFQDEIYSSKEKALDMRVKNLVDYIQEQCPHCRSCIRLKTHFLNENLTLANCTEGHGELLEQEHNLKLPLWIGNEPAATFYVYLANPFILFSYLQKDILIILFFKLTFVALLLSLVNYDPRVVKEKPQVQPNKKANNLFLMDSFKMIGLQDLSVESVNRPVVKPETQKVRQISNAEFRRMLVEILNDSLQLWTECSDKDKIALAMETGLWTVSNDKGTLRTVTLDKYLKENQIPSRPKTKVVKETVQYVLKHTQGSPELRKSLKEKICFLDLVFSEHTVYLKAR